MDKKRTPVTAECDIHKLRDLAVEIRWALDQCEPDTLPITCRAFPHGACGDATLLLAHHLEQRGYRGAEYVCDHTSEYSHAWLEIGGIIMDITADQFENQHETVIVANYSPWHIAFSQTEIHSADFRNYDAATQAIYKRAYLHLLSRIEALGVS